MKFRWLVLALMAGFTTQGAWASNARELTLGRGDGGNLLNKGSLFYDSAYNVFYNPSYINDFKNWVIVEKGFINGNNATATSTATATNQGGFATSLYNLNVGAYVNNTNFMNVDNAVVGDDSVFGVRPIDVFVGGDFGVKVGAGLSYAQQSITGSRFISGSVGAQYENFDPFFHYIVTARDNSAATETKRSGYTAGLRYHFGEWTPYAMYSSIKNETKTATTAKDTSTFYIAGLGRSTKVGETTRLVYSVAYTRAMTDTSGLAVAGNGKGWSARVPVEIGLEGDVLSWLTVRGGVGYRLIDRSGTSGNAADSTYARVGAGFHVGKVDIDWVFGANSGSATAGTGTGTTAASTQSIDAATIGFDSNTFSRVSVSYKW